MDNSYKTSTTASGSRVYDTAAGVLRDVGGLAALWSDIKGGKTETTVPVQDGPTVAQPSPTKSAIADGSPPTWVLVAVAVALLILLDRR